MYRMFFKIITLCGCITASSLVLAADSISIGQLVIRSKTLSSGIEVNKNDSYKLQCSFRDKITKGDVDIIFNNDAAYQFHITSDMPNSFEVSRIQGIDDKYPQQFFINFTVKGSSNFTAESQSKSEIDWTYLTCVGRKL